MVQKPTLKVYIPNKGIEGIRRVYEAQVKHLPAFGVEVINEPNKADVIANHGTSSVEVLGKPMVNHCHGLYWSRFSWGDNYQEANRQVVDAMVRATAHTVPSEWVATAVRRGMLVYPEVVYHGIDAEDWGAIDDPGNYVLWNKARQDPVSDAADMFRVARLLPNIPFISTLGNPTVNVTVIGKVPFERMKGYVMGAGVYLATARETFGIGTLEALASGVPVAGWNWGGQSEIIIDGETGYLAPPGDFEALATCIRRCFRERDRLSENAVQDAFERWSWEPRIEQYAEIYKNVYKTHMQHAKDPKISIIVTCHNLARYLDDCLQSVLDQSLGDWECIIVDDVSDDETPEVAKKWVKKDARFRYERTPENLKLGPARNFGVNHAKGKYIKMLDADDILDHQALRIESDLLDSDSSIHITYGHLDIVDEDGGNRRRNQDIRNGRVISEWPFKQFSWREQMAHLNQLPYCAMIRKDAFIRAGGYRKRHWRAEDAALWCKMTSLGFRAKKATNRSTLIYRNRNDSKSKDEGGDGDWTAWYPWRMGAANPRDASKLVKRMRQKWVPDAAIVPFGVQGKPPKNIKFWFVHDYAYPKVSVIITVGPGHEQYLEDALDSVMAQTYPDWECIVVNDTGEEWEEGLDNPVRGAPWAQVFTMDGGSGPSAARNFGAKHARGEIFAFLDADDYWLDRFLERTIAQAEVYDGIIYTDWLRNMSDGSALETYQSGEFHCEKVMKRMHHAGTSILVPRWVHEKIGGWDENMKGWEDWEYLIAAQCLAGACSYRVDEFLFVYRFTSGSMREKAWGNREMLIKYIGDKWKDYYEGEKTVMCGCKNPHKKIGSRPSSIYSSSGNFAHNQADGENIETTEPMVLLRYNGIYDGPITIKGPVTGKRYRFGRQESHRNKWVFADDAKILVTRQGAEGPEFLEGDIDEAEAGGAISPEQFTGKQMTDTELATQQMPGL